MGLTPRERRVIQLYLIEGLTFAELRRFFNKDRGDRPYLTTLRLKQILAKAGRKAIFYSDKFVESRSQVTVESNDVN
jgi:hypothetical protein